MEIASVPGTVKDEKEIAEKAYFDALINSGNLSKIFYLLKLKFRQHPAIHINYIISRCSTLQ